ncbi:hypothetical protein [Gordonia sp. (in: high G+C Gram-positive bacteria)]|uniref:hypothetical protein n=1 Tax=Gordonia sp. (in: high G+C Gram-positive bacteria) TaxID=84139 RepID=UPI003C750317
MTAPWNPDALWIKAKLLINHALDDDEPRDFDERALWASLALELLAKAALARVSPLLIAVPNEDGHNLLVASGLVQGEARFTSVQARTLFSRCAKAFKPFSEKEAQTIANARNEYLHGAAASFAPIPPDAWWPRYWAQARILVHACDKDMDDFVGYEYESKVEGHLTRNKKNIEHRAEMLVERARQRLGQFKSGQMRAAELDEWVRRAKCLTAGLRYSASASCPACDGTGLVEGEDVDNAETHYEQISEDDYDAWVDLTVGAAYFSCSECHLILDSYELIEALGLPADFEATTDVGDYWEPEYGND